MRGESVQTKGLWLNGYGVLFTVQYSPEGSHSAMVFDAAIASRTHKDDKYAEAYYYRYLQRRGAGAGVRASGAKVLPLREVARLRRHTMHTLKIIRRMTRVSGLALAGLWLHALCGSGQLIAQERKPLDRDLRIMEIVLDRLVLGTTWRGHTETKGIPIKGYGVLFVVPYSKAQEYVSFATLDTTFKDRANLPETYKQLMALYAQMAGKHLLSVDSLAQLGGRSKLSPRQLVASTKEALTDFFTNWVGALSGLPPEANVTVVVSYGEGLPSAVSSVAPSLVGGVLPWRLVASAKMGDILAVRKGTVTPEAFASKIQFSEDRPKKADPKAELEVLAEVVNSELMELRGAGLAWLGRTWTVRVPGLGVLLASELGVGSPPSLFYEEATRAYEEAIRAYEEGTRAYAEGQEAAKQLKEVKELLAPLVQESAEKADTLTPRKRARTSPTKGSERSTAQEPLPEKKKFVRAQAEKLQVEKLTEELIDLMARYAPSLRTVGDEEFLLVAIDLASFSPVTGPVQLCVKMRMADVKKLARGALSSEEFRKQVEVIQR